MTDCPICGGKGDGSYRATDENCRCSAEPFGYATCRTCKTVFLTNPPADLERYYEDEYYSIPSLERLAEMGAKESFKVEIVNRFASGKRLLEVGPAYGIFALQAKRAGYDVDTIEMDARCCAYLRETVGVNATQSDEPHEAIAAMEPHDVIVLWHVLEHLPQIPELVEAAAANLAPDGILIVATPNPGAAQFRLMGSHWPHLDAPRHLALVPPEALAGLARRHGLERAFVTTGDPEGRKWDRFGWQRLLMNRFRSRLMQRAMFVAGYGVGLLMVPFDRREMRGSAFTMVLRKPAP
ncbi:MAG TPA: class I SAM-dependent methyltransferase [Sphingomicrobium sp.]|nr:class I SAM-dependent methyltransferase [Sphingomicrobium sp.]